MIGLLTMSLLACEDEEVAIDLTIHEAEIIGRDATRWVCGGGWFLAMERDTVTVQRIPNQEIEDMLEPESLDIEDPIKVYVVFYEPPITTCAVEFDRVKEIREIYLRRN